MAVKPSPPPFDPNQKPKPSTGNANDTAKPKPKPGPMPPSIDPPQRAPGKTGFDYERWKASRPQTRVIMPGQGQGPMPIGTRPLPQPVVKDARGGGGLEDWMKSHPGGNNPDEDGGWTRRDMDPTKNANVNNPLWDGYRGGGMDRGGDVGFGEDPNKRYGGGQGEGKWGQRWQPGLSGVGDYEGVTTPGSWVNNGDPNAPQMHAMGPGGGPSWNEQERGMSLPPGFDIGKLTNIGMGRGGQFDPSRDFKGPPGQGGQQIPPQYGDQQVFGGGPKGSSVDTNYGAPVERNPQGPKMGGWNNQLVEGTPEYGDWMRRQNEQRGAPSGGKPAQGAPPPQDPGMGGQRPPRPTRPPQGRPPVNPQQMQQGAQELYNDNTIPHEFKGQLLQAAQSGDPMAFNQMLFNSNIPHATKLKLQQMFGYGGQGGAPTQSAQPDQGQQQDPGPYNSQGSPYYGAF